MPCGCSGPAAMVSWASLKSVQLACELRLGRLSPPSCFFRRGRVSAESGLLSWGLMRLKQSAGEGIFRRAFLIERLKAIVVS